MRTYLQAKTMAKSLRAALAGKGIELSHAACLEIVARELGFAEWNMLAAKIGHDTGDRAPLAQERGISLQPPVPIVPVASVSAAREFYLDVLGFAADWGWPDDDRGRRFYAQISRSGVQLYLRERRGSDEPGIELLIRMSGLDGLLAELAANNGRHALPLEVRHTPDDRRELQVEDPFGNRLRFSENNPPGVSAPS